MFFLMLEVKCVGFNIKVELSSLCMFQRTCLTVQLGFHPQVYHYGNYDENSGTEAASFKPGDGVKIAVDGTRRTLNSRFVNLPHSLVTKYGAKEYSTT